MFVVAAVVKRFSEFITITKYVEGANIVVCSEPCLRLVEDSDGLRLSLRGVQGVAAGVANKVLVITQEDDAGTGFRLENKQEQRNTEEKKLTANLKIKCPGATITSTASSSCAQNFFFSSNLTSLLPLRK